MAKTASIQANNRKTVFEKPIVGIWRKGERFYRSLVESFFHVLYTIKKGCEFQTNQNPQPIGQYESQLIALWLLLNIAATNYCLIHQSSLKNALLFSIPIL